MMRQLTSQAPHPNPSPRGRGANRCSTCRSICGAAWIACTLLSACGRSTEPPPDILKTQREDLNKAKGTEKMLLDSAERQKAEIDSQQK
jgi:hypothetical protein